MKKLLLVTVLLAITGIGYPLLNEDTSDECGAFEARLTTLLSSEQKDASATIFLAAVERKFSNGTIATLLAKQRYPNVPPALVCGIAYWRIFSDPHMAERVMEKLLARTQAVDDMLAPLSPAQQAAKLMQPPPVAAPADAAPNYSRDQKQLDQVIHTQH